METCSICLNEVRSTRNTQPIRCGHVFHSHCLEKWKEKGKNTCPVCRKVFDGKRFHVTMTVTNNYTGRSNALTLTENEIFNVFDVFDMNMEFDDVVDLDSLFTDLGMTLSDLDPLVLDTEG